MFQKILLAVVISFNISTSLAQETDTVYYIEESEQLRDNIVEITPLLTVVENFCDRTPEVQEAVLRKLLEKTDCAEVTVEDLSTIKVLDLHHKNLETLQFYDFSDLTSLEWLSLAYNQLSSLPEGIFSDLQALQSLYLKYNNLSSLPKTVFSNLDSLWELYLAENNLSMQEKERVRRQWGGKVKF